MAANVIVFPETDQAEWLNKIIQQLWPFLGDFMDDVLKKNVQPKVQEAVLSSFTFSKVDMGTKPLRVEGVKVYSIREGEIYMDLDINYHGNADIDVGLLGVDNAAGIKDIVLKGALRVVMKPLLSAAPLIGGVAFFFITNPILDFNLTNLANIMDIPMFKEKLQCIIQGQLSNLLVFPKRMEYVIGEGTKFTKQHCPRPQGVLNIKVVEAKNLRDADTLGKNSDPYAVVTVGDQTFQTNTIDNTSNPQWNQTYDALVDLAEEHLTIKIMDEDKVAKDDSLGHATFELSHVIEKGMLDEWLELEGEKKQGSVHLVLQWYFLASDPTLLEKGDCPRCLLMICVHSAQGLMKADQKPEDLSPAVCISFGEQEFTSTAAAPAPDPSWEEDFRFLMTCSGEQKLNIEVKDTKKETTYGTAEIDIGDLTGSADMTIDQSYPLVTEIPDITPQIKLKMVLRVLTPDTDPRWLADSFQ